MPSDWYPTTLAGLDSWHNNFDTQAQATGATFGFGGSTITQISDDAALVNFCTDMDAQIRAFSQAWTQYRDILLKGDPLASMPAVPTAPVLTVPTAAGTNKPGIEARTRGYANQIKAHPAYTQAVGEDYGIVAPSGGAAFSTPSVTATALSNSHVRLSIGKGGYSVLAVDMRRGGGAWTQIGVSQTATFEDATAPTVVGAPEVREYRVQGLVNNARDGSPSAVVSAVTIP